MDVTRWVRTHERVLKLVFCLGSWIRSCYDVSSSGFGGRVVVGLLAGSSSARSALLTRSAGQWGNGGGKAGHEVDVVTRLPCHQVVIAECLLP